jgi:hypothetical protein
MTSPIDIFQTIDRKLCTNDDPQAAFLVVRKGCFIQDGDAKQLKLQEFIDAQTLAIKIIPAVKPEEPVKSLQVVDIATKGKKSSGK